MDIAPRKLQVKVTVTNPTNKRVQIEFGACSVWILGYQTPDRSGTPAWGERKRPNPDPHTGIGWACPAYLAGVTLGPGESASPKEFQRLIPEPGMLGDALPDGHYYFNAVVEVNNTSVEVLAGEAKLVREQEPLPSVRTVGNLKYEAQTDLLFEPTAVIRATLTVTNVDSHHQVATVPRD